MKQYLIANYHAHTPRCKHAQGTEREYIEAAIKAGIKVFGFSDHGPVPYEDGFVSGIRMDMSEGKDYVATIRALGEEYKDRIQVLVGFEIEYLPEYFEEQLQSYEEWGYDYLIMGQHFVFHEKIGPYTANPTWDYDLLKAYVDRVIEGAKTGKFLYIAHPDIINYQGSEELYRQELTRLCHVMKELSIPLEINFLGLREGRNYPAERLLEIAGEVGNDIIFGIDAHRTEVIGDRKDYEMAMELVKKYNLRLLEKCTI